VGGTHRDEAALAPSSAHPIRPLTRIGSESAVMPAGGRQELIGFPSGGVLPQGLGGWGAVRDV